MTEYLQRYLQEYTKIVQNVILEVLNQSLLKQVKHFFLLIKVSSEVKIALKIWFKADNKELLLNKNPYIDD